MEKKLAKILLVEDDELIRNMYRTKLENDNFEVVTADNGGDALKIASDNLPDIILLDVILPQLDGFSVLKELKENKATKNIPVVMLTNLGTDEDKQKGEELKAIGYLVKANLTPTQVSDNVKTFLKLK